MHLFAAAAATGGLALLLSQAPPPTTLPKKVAAAPPPAAAKKAATPVKKPAVPEFDKPKLEAYVRHLFVLGPQYKLDIADPKPNATLPGFSDVQVKITFGDRSVENLFYVSANGQKIVQGTVYDIAKNPFADLNAKLKTEGEPSLGTPGAPVALILFSDFQCPYCKEEAKVLRQNLLKEYPTQVRLYFKDNPLDPIHPWARPASLAGRCVMRQNAPAFWDFHDWIFEKQAEITPANLRDKTIEWVASKPDLQLNKEQFTTCYDTKSTAMDIERSSENARELGITQTPVLFINGRRLNGGADWNTLKTIIDFELDYQKTAKNAGDTACCTIELKLPLGNK